MRKCVLLCSFLFSFCLLIAQVPSPDQFLGYSIGIKFTPHYKIVNYFKALSQAKPDKIKLEKYGETYEGRELFLVYISTTDNISNLESIRKNNVALTNSKNATASTNAPAIVWLSYNVHGNEPSSSEAAMLTAYALVNGDLANTHDWLKNTVVIIDPCLNPDGRDRYEHWYNSIKGKNTNIDPQSREHSEPWPGGRSNHYNFDLNRDWAWQTQIETQQRVIKYYAWMPQIHVDFHEQGYDDPYYFAPAAEPFHEVITPWQKELQMLIGKNNAKYFDQNNWLYFTKERFDLFYPAYGDTYPTYNGAIGMTYEQGGHSRSGLGVIKADGDTLTLADRVFHHYTTGLSTIEVAAAQSKKILEEFKKFFDNSKNGEGSEFKTYILTSNDFHKLKTVAVLLKKNNIEYGITKTENIKGYNYQTNKNESINVEKYQLAVTAYQPHSILAKVLLEPKGKLSDSVTYDITAWSIPYAYGVKAYGVAEKLEIKNEDIFKQSIITPNKAYGYVKEWYSVNDAKFLAVLLQRNIRVRFTEREFVISGKKYDRGTLVILKTSNHHIKDIDNTIKTIADSLQTNVTPIETAFVESGADLGSPDVKMIKAPKVALLTGEQASSLNAGEIWHFFDQQLNYPVSLLHANEMVRLNLNAYNVLIIPDGHYRFFSDKNILEKLKQFVQGGGKLIVIQNAVAQLASTDWGIKLKEEKEDKEKNKDEYTDLVKYGDRERSEMPNSMPGAIYKINIDNTHPLGFGYPDYYYSLKQDVHAYGFLKDGWNVGVIKKNDHVSGFVGNTVKQKLKDALVFGVQEKGSGSIVYMADNPLFRLFWENGKLLFCNAVFLVNQ